MSHSYICPIDRRSWPHVARMGLLASAVFLVGCQSKIDRPRVQAFRALHEPRCTAELDDPAWDGAMQIDELTLSAGPEAAGLAPIPTRVQLAWTERALFVRFTCVGEMSVRPSDPNDLSSGDLVEVFLDPVGDGHQFWEVQVNSAGQVRSLSDMVRHLYPEILLKAAGLCDGHSILKPKAFLEVGLPADVVEYLTRTYTSDGSPKGTIFVAGRPVKELKGVYGRLDVLRFLAEALGVEYRSAIGRGFEAQNIQ